MKIVILPGVGFENIPPWTELLLRKLKCLNNCEVEWFDWKHSLNIPSSQILIDLNYTDFRKWVCEVILDFQMVVKHAKDVVIPECDYIIGHSAGSIIALVNNIPSIIFGSPAILVEDILRDKIRDLTVNKKIYNIVHESDVLAYPIPFNDVENVTYQTSVFNYTHWLPMQAHRSYWNNPQVVKLILNKLIEWQKEKIKSKGS